MHQMLDKEGIRDAADIIVVAEELGIPISYNRRKPMILCPCHDDHNFGSCYIDPKKKTFHCYSCGAKGDVFSLAQHSLNVSFYEAEKFVAETCGGTKQFRITEGQEEKEKREISRKLIPQADMDFIGLHSSPVYVTTNFQWSINDIPEEDRENTSQVRDKYGYLEGYRIQRCVVQNPLFALYRDDEDAYHELIDDFCKRKIDALNDAVAAFKFGSASPYVQEAVDSTLKYVSVDEMVTTLVELIKKAQEISVAYGNGAAAKQVVSPDVERISVIVNNIWMQNEKAPF